MRDLSKPRTGEAQADDRAERIRWWQRLLPQSMAGRLIALLLITLVVSQLAGLAFFFGERRQALQGVAVRNVLTRTVMVAGLIESTPANLHEAVLRASSSPEVRFRLSDQPLVARGEESRLAQRLSRRMSDTIQGFRGDVRVRRSIRPRFSSWRDGDRAFSRERLRDLPPRLRRQERRRRNRRRLRWLQASVELAPSVWLNLRAAQPAATNNALLPLLGTLALVALSIGLVAAWAIRRTTRPIRALGDAAQRMGRGERIETVPLEGPVEVRSATAAFNAMNERVSRFVADRTRMLGAISHDLRTPITTLRLRAETIEQDEVRERMLATLDEMQRMAEETLAFVRDDATAEETRSTDVTALVESVCSDLGEVGRAVRFEDSPRLVAACRPIAIKRAVRNLVDNAVTYGGEARVRLVVQNAKSLAIQIDDRGPGLSADDLAQAFEPFFRVDRSRNRKTGGVGLGLAIARSIVTAHGGEVRLANLPNRGLRAEIVLPI